MFFIERRNDMRKREHKQNLSLNSGDPPFEGIALLRDLHTICVVHKFDCFLWVFK